MKRKKGNPVKTMDSVHALDLLVRVKTELRERQDVTIGTIVEINEQIRRHQRALRVVIGEEEL